MLGRPVNYKFLFAALLIITVIAICVSGILAVPMKSPSYSIPSNDINTYGAIKSSASYILNDNGSQPILHGSLSGLITLPMVYVSTTGSDTTGDGSIGKPFKTIQKGLLEVAPGGTIHIAAGIYPENNILWPYRDNITLIGAGAASTILSAEARGRGIIVGTALSLTIEGLMIRDGYGSDGSPYNGNGGGLLLAAGGSNVSLKNVGLFNNRALGHSGAVLSSGSTIKAINCLFYKNQAQNGGVSYASSATWEIMNCTFANNISDYGGNVGSYGTWNAVNSIFWGSDYQFKWEINNAKGSFKNCAVQGTLSTFIDKGGNLFNVVPLLVDAANGDLHLSLTSECINAGTLEGAPFKDIEGRIRPLGKACDIGAYEFAINRPQIIKNSIKIDGYGLNELIGLSKRPVFDYEFTDEYASYVMASAEVILNNQPHSIVPEPVAGTLNTYHITYSINATLEAGLYPLVLRVTNFLGESDEFTKTISSGILSVSGKPKNVPNPFRPRHGEGTTFIYKLTSDSNIKMIIYDITGKAVVQRSFSSGSNGGKLGDNNVYWDGRTDFDEYAANGVYVYIIIDSNNKVLSKGQITVVD